MQPGADFKIFIVDDDPFSLKLFQQSLQNLGYSDLALYSDGQRCLADLHKKPDVIFLDLQLEEHDGLELLIRIKRSKSSIYVVVVSGNERLQTGVDALKHGAFDYILKGPDTIARMDDALERIRQIREVMRNTKPSIFRRLLTLL